MKLEVLVGPDAGRAFAFEDDVEVAIGRDPSGDVHLADKQCSRRHARLYLDRERIHIQDLGSTNGLRVNGRPQRTTVLCPGDEIGVGKSTLRISEIPVTGTSTPVTMCDTSDSVLLSLHHTDADLLAGDGRTPAAARELDDEGRILRELCDMSSLVAATHDVQTSLERIVARVNGFLGAHTTCILSQSADGEWVGRASQGGGDIESGISVSQTIVGQAMREGVAILSANPLEDGRFVPSESIVSSGLTSAMCSPIKVDDEFVAVLFVDRRESGNPFRQIDLRFAATVGNLVGMLMEQERLQFEARDQQRLATIGEVMAGLAHYAKNIIQGLRFSVGTLRVAVERDTLDRLPGCLESVLAQERRISELVLDMLSYSKDRKPNHVPVQIAVLIDEITAPYRGELKELGAEFRVSSAPDCPVIRADEQALHRVFLNLLSNAMDAVEDSDEDRERRIDVSVDSAEGGGVTVGFRDTGVGIPADKLDSIFDVFYSTKGTDGTGLGLAVVSKIVQEHGGEISVTSSEGEWTEFSVSLPCGGNGESEESR